MYDGAVFTLAVATQRGHASCEHAIVPGELFALAANGSSACLDCSVSGAGYILHENVGRGLIDKTQAARAIVALRVFATSYGAQSSPVAIQAFRRRSPEAG